MYFDKLIFRMFCSEIFYGMLCNKFRIRKILMSVEFSIEIMVVEVLNFFINEGNRSLNEVIKFFI